MTKLAGMNAAYALLDDPQRWAAFSLPARHHLATDTKPGAHAWQSQVVVQGMHCAACALNVEAALSAVPGVKQVTVNGATHRAQITWSADEVRPSAWMQALVNAGYQALPAQDFMARDAGQTEMRQQLWRWLVAGFCMMQVMMYAWPAYVSAPGEIAPNMLDLLRWASWVLSLPVMFFSADVFTAAAWRDLKQGRISMDLPVALGIWVTFIVSSAAVFEPNGLLGDQVYFDSLTMFVFFLLTGRWLQSRLRERTAGALEALINQLPQTVQRFHHNGRLETVGVHQLKPGDVLQICPGEVIAADGEVVKGHTWVEEALLTGESAPLLRKPGDNLLAGSHNLRETIEMRVDKIGESTRYAAIVSLMQSASLHKPRLAWLADRLAKPFLGTVLLAAGLSALLAWPTSPGQALMVAVAVLIVTCPCALSLATPAAMLAAAGRLARQGVLLRDVQSLETMSQVKAVVFDKTGTLTKDKMQLQAMFTPEGSWSAHQQSDIQANTSFLLAAQLAKHSSHPYARAVLGLLDESLPALPLEDVQEHVGQGLSARLRSPDGLQTKGLRLGSLAFCQSWPERGSVPHQAMGAQVHLCDESGWLASFAFEETVRDDAVSSVDRLRALGMAVYVMSGDKPDAVERVRAVLRLPADQVFAACSPQDKLFHLKALQAKGLQVAMVGDGFNDMPVLAGAHVSFAFGQAVPLAQAKADVVVQGQQLQAVADTFALAQRTQTVVHQNLMWAALYNAVCVPLAFFGYLPPWLAGLGMAASSLWVVLNAMRLTLPPKPQALAATQA